MLPMRKGPGAAVRPGKPIGAAWKRKVTALSPDKIVVRGARQHNLRAWMWRYRATSWWC